MKTEQFCSLRIGTVSSIKSGERKVRVKFPDTGIMSGWLHVVQSFELPDHDTHYPEPECSDCCKTCPFTGNKTWMPKVNDTVMCIYDSGFNADGYVMGVLR